MSLGDSSTPIGKVRGLGSAHHGGGHWLTERVTSIALLVLGIWLIASLLMLPKVDQRTAIQFDEQQLLALLGGDQRAACGQERDAVQALVGSNATAVLTGRHEGADEFAALHVDDRDAAAPVVGDRGDRAIG